MPVNRTNTLLPSRSIRSSGPAAGARLTATTFIDAISQASRDFIFIRLAVQIHVTVTVGSAPTPTRLPQGKRESPEELRQHKWHIRPATTPFALFITWELPALSKAESRPKSNQRTT